MENYSGFLTVGTQLPFDRLTKLVEGYCKENNDVTFIMQVGKSGYCPPGFECYEEIDQQKYDELLNHSDFIIAHCGIGIIVSAAQCGKPVACCPREAALKEHRNNHQLDTADAIKDSVPVFRNISELTRILNDFKKLEFVRNADIINNNFIEELKVLLV